MQGNVKDISDEGAIILIDKQGTEIEILDASIEEID